VICSIICSLLLFYGGWPLFHLPLQLVGRPFQSFYAWAMMFAVLAIFLRKFDRPIALIAYVRDFAYFAYLAHLPLVLLFIMELRDVEMPPLARMLTVLSLTVATLLMLFQVMVRPYAIGKILGVRGQTPARVSPFPPVQVTAT